MTYQEGPRRGERFQVVGIVEPDHQHREAHDDGERDIDPVERQYVANEQIFESYQNMSYMNPGCTCPLGTA